MDMAAQRTQAHALVDALPQDSLEIVVALMRKLTDFTEQPISNTANPALSESQTASINRVRSLVGCFSDCQSKDWKEEKSDFMQEKYHS